MGTAHDHHLPPILLLVGVRPLPQTPELPVPPEEGDEVIDPRKVDAGAKALAERMGCTNPSDWTLFRGEARAVLEAAEKESAHAS